LAKFNADKSQRLSAIVNEGKSITPEIEKLKAEILVFQEVNKTVEHANEIAEASIKEIDDEIYGLKCNIKYSAEPSDNTKSIS